MHVLTLFAVVLLTTVPISGFNLTRLISLYINSCGREKVCYDWQGFPPRNHQSNPIAERCPKCSCTEDCFRRENCCPDKFFLEQKLRTKRYPLYDMTPIVNQRSNSLPQYYVVDSCPEISKRDSISMCQTPPRGIKNRIFVTSLVSNYTYFNIQCALCHSENEISLQKWEITIDVSGGILNFIDSDEALQNVSALYKRAIIFHPPEFLEHIVIPIESYEEAQDCFDDTDLQAACKSSYLNEYRRAKNIFCYMCKLRRHLRPNETISSCFSSFSELRDLCADKPSSELVYPYKNFYCFFCNIPYSFISGINRREQRKEETKYTFLDLSTYLTENKEDKTFLFAQNVYNDLSLLKTISTAQFNRQTPRNKFHSYNLEYFRDLLNTLVAIYPHRICKRDILPSDFQTLSRQECDCSPRCLFTNSCACCLDTALSYVVECIPVIRAGFSEKLSNSKTIQVISSCYKEKNKTENMSVEEKIKNLCKSNGFNNFDHPVLSQNITYKNVFCFLCNTYYSITNDSLTTERYKILDIRVLCRNQFNFDFFLNFSQVLAESFRMQCDIKYEVEDLALCSEHALQKVSTCDGTTQHVDSAVQWACENSSQQSFRPIGEYRNIFCLVCNSRYQFTPGDVTVCNDTNSHHLLYKNACMSLPDVSYHPAVHSYRNAFCYLCQNDTYNLPPFPSEECSAPVLGQRVPVIMVSLRDLFVPMSTLKANLIETRSQSTEFGGCFPGRVIENGVCTPVIQYPSFIKYTLHVLCRLEASSSTNDTNYVLSEIKKSVAQFLVDSSKGKDQALQSFYFLPELPISISYRNGLFFYELQVTLNYMLLYTKQFNRDSAEKELLRTPSTLKIYNTINGTYLITFRLESFQFSNFSKSMLSENRMDDYISFKQFFRYVNLIRPHINIIVSDLLVCIHTIFDFSDVNMKQTHVMVKRTKEVYFLGEFLVDYANRIRVCAKFPSKPSSLTPITKYLDSLTTVLNIISILAIALLFSIYMFIPDLRTVPGEVVMITSFSLFCMQLTYTVSSTMPKRTTSCMVTGILLHYFWLCLCCSMFICCYHMFISFRRRTLIRDKSELRTCLRYSAFCFAFPVIIVSLNLVISRYLTGHIGYGTRICFVENTIQNFVTFITPLILTCTGNTILFTLAILNIRQDKNLQKSRGNISEFVICMKLFCLTGSVWILLVIDSFLNISFFSFVATILTSSQGIFIFLSFALSSRILKQFKKRIKA